MKKRIIDYRLRIDSILTNNPEETDWQSLMEEHLTQIAFFQHERLVHLIVTLLVAVVAMMAFGMALSSPGIFIGILVLLLIVLLAAYILHYYTLENEVQKMYSQYDKILEHINKKR